MNGKIWLAPLAACALLCGCGRGDHREQPAGPAADTDYSLETSWFAQGGQGKAADVFYVYPTVATASYQANGNSWLADIDNAEARAGANQNQRFNQLLYSDYNFYAPYYRQLIMDAYRLPPDQLSRHAAEAAREVRAAFRHYIERHNQGRPFFLVGHSQGSQMLLEVLKEAMTDAEHARMVAAYCIGYKVTSDDLRRHPRRLRPAGDSVSQGALVVINSLTRPDAVSPLLAGGAVGINPLTWDTTGAVGGRELHLGAAAYTAGGDSVALGPPLTGGRLAGRHMLCDDLPDDFAHAPALADLFPTGNLHLADSWLFAGNVVANMACRLRHRGAGKTAESGRGPIPSPN